VRSSHSQREPAKTRIQTQILTIVSPALYHWPIPLHKVIYVFCCRGLGLHRGVERIDNTVTVPESWAEFTNGNIKRSQAERGASKQMRNDIQSMLNGAGEDLWKQWNKVRRATVYQEDTFELLIPFQQSVWSSSNGSRQDIEYIWDLSNAWSGQISEIFVSKQWNQ